MQKTKPIQLIALAAFLIALPLLVGAIYDKFNPQSVAVDDRFKPTFEQFKVDTYERLTDRDLRFSQLWDEAKMRQAYDAIATEHWKLATDQTNRRLLMYGSLAIASLGYLLIMWIVSRKEAHPLAAQAVEAVEAPQEPAKRQRRGIVIKPKEKQ